MSTLDLPLTQPDKLKNKIYTTDETALLDWNLIPRHIAIIPDGNRRWAKKQQSFIEEGHRQGADVIMDIVKAGIELGVQVITIYLFSTENWSRPPEEVDALMWLLQSYLINQRETMLENGIRLETIGDLSRLSKQVIETIDESKQATRRCDKIDLVFAINYGGRDDIRRAIKKIIAEAEEEKIDPNSITESLISSYLDTAQFGDPDLLIRTSGEIRISNFLLWQISYSEMYVTDILWPDFSQKNFLDAIYNFQKRNRRLGGA